MGQLYSSGTSIVSDVTASAGRISPKAGPPAAPRRCGAADGSELPRRALRSAARQWLWVALLTGGQALGLAGAVHAGDVVGEVTVGGRPVRNAVLFVEDLRSPPVDARTVMDQRHRTFIPHVLVVQVGTRVEFPNNDSVFHN